VRADPRRLRAAEGRVRLIVIVGDSHGFFIGAKWNHRYDWPEGFIPV